MTTRRDEGAVQVRVPSVDAATPEPRTPREVAVDRVFGGGALVVGGISAVSATVAAATLWTSFVGPIHPAAGVAANAVIAAGLLGTGAGLVRIGSVATYLRGFGNRFGHRSLSALAGFGTSFSVWAVPTILGVFTGPTIPLLEGIAAAGVLGMAVSATVLLVLVGFGLVDRATASAHVNASFGDAP